MSIMLKEVGLIKQYMGKIEHGSDLLLALTEVCKTHEVRLGRIEAIGAVQKANVGYYAQDTRTYHFNEILKPLEITNLTGNISIKDGEPMVHAHITLADDEDRAFGGHLGPGTIIFACEFVLQVFEGPDLVRGFDEKTGLPLWT